VCREIVDIDRAGLIAAVEQAADGIVITDTDGKIQYVNPAFTRMTGYTREEAVGQNPRIFKSGRHPVAYYEELWKTIRAGGAWSGEVVNRRKDGTFYTEQMRIAPVRASSGEVVSYIAIKHDVTERRAAEETQGLLAAIVQSSGDAIFAYAPSGFILTWNRGAEAIFGYSSAEVTGKHLSILVAPERRPFLPAFTERALRGNAIPQYESVCLHKGGRRIHVSVTSSPVRNSAGDAVAVSVIVRDITERREAEQARALLASIVESSDDAIKGISVDGTVVSWNQGAEELFGYSSQEIIGESVAILVPPDRRHEMIRNLATVLKGGNVSPFDTVRQSKDGRIAVRLPNAESSARDRGRFRHRPRHRQALADRAEASGKRRAIPRGL
jgi:PAS domain S-box-containing protein